MSKDKKIKSKKPQSRARDAPMVWLTDANGWDDLCVKGYTRLDKCPEVVAGVNRIADLLSSMTIYLMENTGSGDKRIVNQLSRQVDITPCRTMTRKTWMHAIVNNLLLYGNGNCVVRVHTKDGLLDDLEPIPPGRVSFLPDPVGGYGYRISIDGVLYDPDNLLHFVDNPDPDRPWMGQGKTTVLRDVATSLRQAAETVMAFNGSKWRPSIIVKVDGLTDEFSSPSGRKKLLDEYIQTSGEGEPWMIPAEAFSVEQVKPLSLADLAINDNIKLDKRTVAAILGVPPHLMGVGDFAQGEWNAFISNVLRPLAREIEQELTRKLLYNPAWYWKFNIASLYSYDLSVMSEVYTGLYSRGLCTGNEARDKLGMEPLEGLDDLILLENYIPKDKLGDQLKLKQDGGN